MEMLWGKVLFLQELQMQRLSFCTYNTVLWNNVRRNMRREEVRKGARLCRKMSIWFIKDRNYISSKGIFSVNSIPHIQYSGATYLFYLHSVLGSLSVRYFSLDCFSLDCCNNFLSGFLAPRSPFSNPVFTYSQRSFFKCVSLYWSHFFLLKKLFCWT